MIHQNKQPLSLTPELSSHQWTPFLEDEVTNSYSYHLRGNNENVFSKDVLDGWFRDLHPSYLPDAWTDAYYKGELLLRKTAWTVLNPECQCEYGYSDTWQPISGSSKLKQILEEITAEVLQVTGGTVNSCNLNYYPQGGGVGFHADDEFLFDGLERPTRILSLSLCSASGGARNFQIKQKDHEDDTVHEIVLEHGDLMTMEGWFQKFYLHSVWPGDSPNYREHPHTQGERINLTWRTIVQHLDGSPECRGKVCPLASSMAKESLDGMASKPRKHQRGHS